MNSKGPTSSQGLSFNSGFNSSVKTLTTARALYESWNATLLIWTVITRQKEKQQRLLFMGEWNYTSGWDTAVINIPYRKSFFFFYVKFDVNFRFKEIRKTRCFRGVQVFKDKYKQQEHNLAFNSPFLPRLHWLLQAYVCLIVGSCQPTWAYTG